MTAKNPYRIPDDGFGRVINFSGGRSSAYMLWHILNAHDGKLPEKTVVCFANTGKEEPETLEFVRECQNRWGVPIVWLEYRYFPDLEGWGAGKWRHQHERVSFDSASRNGEPFQAAITARQCLPTVHRRFCTTLLKVKPIAWYTRRELGWDSAIKNIIGIRADEPGRIGKAIFEMCSSEYPMVHALVTNSHVRQWWRQQDFDLRTRNSNCDLCFLKGAKILNTLIKEQPSRADWWVEREAEIAVRRGVGGGGGDKDKRPKVAQFSDKWSYQSIRAKSLDGFEGEQLAFDCFCGD